MLLNMTKNNWQGTAQIRKGLLAYVLTLKMFLITHIMLYEEYRDLWKVDKLF